MRDIQRRINKKEGDVATKGKGKLLGLGIPMLKSLTRRT
jgi:hypothetical protein